MTNSCAVNESDINKVLEKYACGSDNLHDHIGIYNSVASTFDEDMAKVKCVTPENFADTIAKIGIKKNAKILDMCCGTGLVGYRLASKGFDNIYGFDGSKEMLELAKLKGSYKTLKQLIFEPSTKLPLDNQTFDCTIACGAFGPGHLPRSALRELIRVTKVGGTLLFEFHQASETSPYQATYDFYNDVMSVVDEKLVDLYEGYPKKEKHYILGYECTFLMKRLK